MRLTMSTECQMTDRIEQAAAALRALTSMDELLRFPAEYVSAHERGLRSLARYTNGALAPWESAWGQDLRKSGIREVAWVVIKALTGGEAYAIAPDIDEADREVIQRQLLIYEAVSAVNYGCSMRLLWCEAGAGDEEALVKLVRLDKSFLTMPFCRGIVKRRMHAGDWEFFERLGKAIAAHPLKEPPQLYGAVLLTAGFWDDRYRALPYPVIVAELEGYGLWSKGINPRTFAQRLRRAGLVKD